MQAEKLIIDGNMSSHNEQLESADWHFRQQENGYTYDFINFIQNILLIVQKYAGYSLFYCNQLWSSYVNIRVVEYVHMHSLV